MASPARTLVIAVTAAVAGALGGFAGSVGADQPRMQSALSHLESAERDLEAATNDKGGHRVEALRLVRAAQTQVRKGIKFDRVN
jgi:hypothetical protein